MTLTRENRQGLLAKIDHLVTTKYYDPGYGGNNWNGIISCYRDEILEAKTDEAFEKSVSTMLRQLPSAELGLLSPSTKIQSRSSINASVRSVKTDSDGPQWMFQDVLPGRVAERAGVRPGDSLVSIAGVATRPPQPPAFPMNERVAITIYRGSMLTT
jgi:C-terminal processing protease CtpA/Prc